MPEINCCKDNSNSVSCIIVNYNAGLILLDCVIAAVIQADQIVLVDNNSSDESIKIVLEYFPSNSKLKVIQSSSNVGFAAGCNLGAAASTGKYLLFLNPDCILQPDSLNKMVQCLQSSADIGMVGGLLMDPDGTEQGGGRRAVPTPWRSFVRAFGLYRFANRWPRLFYDFYLHKQPLPKQAIEVEAISGACMLVKREAVDEIGLWDEGYFLHCEDLDWCMRFRQKGYKILFVPDSPLIHYHGTCCRSKPIFAEWHKHKGMIRFYQKFFKMQYPGPFMWLVTLGVWFRFVLITVNHAIRLAVSSIRGFFA